MTVDDEPPALHRPRLVAAAGDPVAGPDLGRKPAPDHRSRLILASDSPQAIERATLAEAVAAAALHLCCLDTPWHSLNFALAISDRPPNKEVLRQVEMLQSIVGIGSAHTAMAAFDALDMACRAWTPYAHPISRPTDKWR